MKIKNVEKLFTNSKSNNIIKKDYNPLNMNFNEIYRIGGMIMKNQKSNIAKDLTRKYSKKEILLIKMIEMCEKLGYNTEEAKNIIENFEENINCY